MLTIQRITAPSNAARNPETSNPSINVETSQIRAAFTTKVNKPKVRILMGRVKKRITGRIIALTNPKARAVINAAYNPETSNPGTK